MLLGRYLLPGREARGEVLHVKGSEVPANGALVFRTARVAVIREAERLYALRLACTHLGCTVTVTPGELVCPCHGSAFDRRGNVLRGPATRPLDRLPLEQTGDEVVVHL